MQLTATEAEGVAERGEKRVRVEFNLSAQPTRLLASIVANSKR